MLKKQYSKTKPTCKITFSLPKEAVEGANGVKILGEFNNWNPSLGIPMKLSGQEFTAVVELPVGKNYEFRYLADNGVWENDWAADDYVEVPFDVCNSIVSLKNGSVKSSNGNGAAKKAKSTKSTAKSATKSTAKTTVKKATKSRAKKNGADDLKKIEGIGPKIAQLLIDDGVQTFADLAKATKTRLKGILERAGSRYKMHDPTTWAKQAKLAAKGEWDKLKQLQDELIGGKSK